MLIGFVEDSLLPTKTHFEADFVNNLLYVNKILDFFFNDILILLWSLIAPEGK